MNTTVNTADGTTTIEVDHEVALISRTRDFQATPAQLVRAHTDAEIFVRWIGPTPLRLVDRLEPTHRWQLPGRRGPWRRRARVPRMLPRDRARLHATSLVDSFTNHDGIFDRGMEAGVNDGYAKLDRLLIDALI